MLTKIGINTNVYNKDMKEQSVSFEKRHDNKEIKEGKKSSSFMDKAKKGFVGANIALSSLVGNPVVVGTAAVGAGAATMTSCIKMEQNVDLGPIIDILNGIAGKLDKVIDQLDTQYKGFMEAIQLIYEQQKLDAANMKEFQDRIFEVMEEYHLENSLAQQEIIKIMKDESKTAAERYKEVMEVLQNIALSLDRLEKIEDAIIEVGKKNDINTDKIIAKIEELKKDLESGKLSREEFEKKLLLLLGTSVDLSTEIRDKIQVLIDKYSDQGLSDAEILEKILKELQEIKDITSDIAKKLDGISEKMDKNAEKQEENFIKMFDKIVAIATSTASIDAKLDGITDLQKQLLQQNKELAQIQIDLANQMLTELKEIKNKTMSKDEWIEFIGPNFEAILNQLKLNGDKQITIEQIREALNDYKTDLSTTNELLQTQISLLEKIANSGIGASDMAKVIEALTLLQNTNHADSEAMKEALEKANKLLEEIKGIAIDISKKLDGISDKMDKNAEKQEANYIKMFDKIVQMATSTASIDAKLDGITDLQKQLLQQNKELAQTQIDLANQMLTELIGLNNKTMSKDEWIAFIGPNFEAVLNQLKLNGSKQITIEQIREALNDYKVDLSTTNELLQTQISILEKLANSGLGQTDMSKVIEALTLLQNTNHADSEAMKAALEKANKLLEAIKADTGDIKEQLKILTELATQTLKEYQEAKAQAKQDAAEIKQSLNDIKTGMVTPADIADMKNGIREDLAEMKAKQAETVEIVKQILAKQNEAMTREELIKFIKDNVPNYFTVISGLQKSLDDLNLKAGDMVTNTTLNAALEKYKVNLTTTNELIQTAISLLEKISGSGLGGGSVNTSQMESLLGQVLDVLASNKTATAKQLDDLKAEIVKVQDAIKAQGGTPTAFMKKVDNSVDKATKGIRAMAALDNLARYAEIKKEQKENEVPLRYRASTYYGAFNG